jgi:type I restriction enzyme R subunit
LKFRRQFPVENYVVDFCCFERRLVIELDGEVHKEPQQAAHDQNRDKYLRSRGFHVLRFENRSVLEDSPAVLRQIAEALGLGWSLTPDPSPIALPPDRERGATHPLSRAGCQCSPLSRRKGGRWERGGGSGG